MPELPEVETIRMQLEKLAVGQALGHIESFHKKSLIGDPKNVIGGKVSAVKRYGKMLVLELGHEWAIAIHLKMSGQLIYQNHGIRITNHGNTRINEKHLRVKITFKSGDSLLFFDQRIFGWVRVCSHSELAELSYIKNLGKEPWDITDQEFFDKLKTRNRPVKLIILDQEVISGVGNIYANDALWEAGINPRKKAKNLSKSETKHLKEAVIKVLKEGIRYGGSTGSDEKYVNLEGQPGKYQDHMRVYDRKGEPCLNKDGGVIEKISLGGRGTYYCPVCQK